MSTIAVRSWAPLRPIYVRFVARQKNTNILDIGCNKGEIGSMLKNKNCNVSGIDIFDKNQIKELDNYIQCDLDQSLPELNYEELDYILILDVIEHLKDPELFMSRLKKKISTWSRP